MLKFCFRIPFTQTKPCPRWADWTALQQFTNEEKKNPRSDVLTWTSFNHCVLDDFHPTVCFVRAIAGFIAVSLPPATPPTCELSIKTNDLWKRKQEGSPGGRAGAQMETTQSARAETSKWRKRKKPCFCYFPLPATDPANVECFWGRRWLPFQRSQACFTQGWTSSSEQNPLPPKPSYASIYTQTIPSSPLQTF